MSKEEIYCLDTNVLVEAWNYYYSPSFCPQYWDVLDSLGSSKKLFIPQMVFTEIEKKDDDLLNWLKKSSIPVHPNTEKVTLSLKNIFDSNPLHQRLVDSIKGRSVADPWVIAHAITENAVVVTKEGKLTANNSQRIRIPNVCENMGIRCIDDFEFIKEVGIKFNAKL